MSNDLTVTIRGPILASGWVRHNLSYIPHWRLIRNRVIDILNHVQKYADDQLSEIERAREWQVIDARCTRLAQANGLRHRHFWNAGGNSLFMFMNDLQLYGYVLDQERWDFIRKVFERVLGPHPAIVGMEELL